MYHGPSPSQFSTRPSFQRNAFAPSFFEMQPQTEWIPQTYARPREDEREEASQKEQTAEATHDGDKGKGRWTAAETDALVFSWRDCFVELESHKNPAAWRRIIAVIKTKGSGKTTEQAKKKLRNLKDRYKDAKDKNKNSGAARNLPKYYKIFDEVLGTRSLVQLSEVRESGQGIENEQPGDIYEADTPDNACKSEMQ